MIPESFCLEKYVFRAVFDEAESVSFEHLNGVVSYLEIDKFSLNAACAQVLVKVDKFVILDLLCSQDTPDHDFSVVSEDCEGALLVATGQDLSSRRHADELNHVGVWDRNELHDIEVAKVRKSVPVSVAVDTYSPSAERVTEHGQVVDLPFQLLSTVDTVEGRNLVVSLFGNTGIRLGQLMVAVTQCVNEVFSHGYYTSEIPSVCPVPHLQLHIAAIGRFDSFDYIDVAVANHESPILFVIYRGGSYHGHHFLSTGVDAFFVAMLAKVQYLRRVLWVRQVLVLLVEGKRETNYSNFFLDQVDLSDSIRALLLVNDLRVRSKRFLFIVRLVELSICKVIKLETLGL